MKIIICFIILIFSIVNGERDLTNEFAVELLANELTDILDVNAYNLEVVRQVNSLGNVYHLKHREESTDSNYKKLVLDPIFDMLKKHPSVLRVEQQVDLDIEQKPNFKTIYGNTESNKQTSKKRLEELNDYRKKVLNKLTEIDRKLFSDNSTDRIDPELFPMDYVYEENDGRPDVSSTFERSYTLTDDDRLYLGLVKQRQERLKKIHFNDPNADRLWQYNNYGQFHSMNPGLDMNIYSAYLANYTGQGVVVTVVDDGIDTRHVDIAKNYDPAASMDFNNPHTYHGSPRGPTDRDIMPKDEGHGTLCASIIGGVANNHFCAHGVAYNVNLGGIRMLARKMVTDLLEAYALTHNNQYISIYSNSWGPKDSGFKTSPVTHYVGKAFQSGVDKGRGGKGSIFLFAAGNGGLNYDHCGADGMVNSPFTFAVTSVNIYGRKPAYTEECPAISIAAAVGGLGYDDLYYGSPLDPPLIASFINGFCKKRFVGTSAAVPMVAGCIALALEANPNLSWRDVQHLMYISARIPNTKDTVWQLNTAGLLVSGHYGPGLLDCGAFVKNALKWKVVGPRRSCVAAKSNRYQNLIIRQNQRTRLTFKTTACRMAYNSIDFLEHVIVHTKIQHRCRGDLTVILTSPTGTKSYLLKNRRWDDNNKTISFSFLSLMHWNERPAGVWHFDIIDSGLCETEIETFDGEQTGRIFKVTLEFFGTKEIDSAIHRNRQLIKNYLRDIKVVVPLRSYILNEGQVYDIFNNQRRYFINMFPPDRTVPFWIRNDDLEMIGGAKNPAMYQKTYHVHLYPLTILLINFESQ